MSRVRKFNIWPIAVSAEQAADALGIRDRTVRAALERGELVQFQTPEDTRKRILTSDLEAWVRTWPRGELKKRLRS